MDKSNRNALELLREFVFDCDGRLHCPVEEIYPRYGGEKCIYCHQDLPPMVEWFSWAAKRPFYSGWHEWFDNSEHHRDSCIWAKAVKYIQDIDKE